MATPALTRARLLDELDALADLPSRSPVLPRLVATLGREQVEMIEVEAIVRRDPLLAARVLAAANAAAFAGYGPVLTVRGALLRLGLVRVRCLAVMLTLSEAVPVAAALEQAFWRHSLATAGAAAAVLEHLGPGAAPVGTEAISLAGLVHDLGAIVLASRHPGPYRTLAARAAAQGRPRWEVELEALDIEHGEIGGRLAEHWSFPPAIVSAIRAHHRLELAPAGHRWVAAVVRVADVVGTAAGADVDGVGGLADDDPGWRELALGPEILPALLDVARSEAEGRRPC